MGADNCEFMATLHRSHRRALELPGSSRGSRRRTGEDERNFDVLPSVKVGHSCFGPHIELAGLNGRTWPTTSQSNSFRIAARKCRGACTSRRTVTLQSGRHAAWFGLQMFIVKNSPNYRCACFETSSDLVRRILSSVRTFSQFPIGFLPTPQHLDQTSLSLRLLQNGFLSRFYG